MPSQLQIVETIVRYRREQIKRASREAYIEFNKTIHLKQYDTFESEFESALSPMFESQLRSASRELLKITEQKSVSSDQATQLANQIFRPDDWLPELIDRALPVFAVAASNAMRSQLLVMGLDESKLARCGIKATTATEWLAGQGMLNALDEVIFSTPYGRVSMGFVTEYPVWMKREIEKLLQETFSQQYWQQVNQTTHADIEKYIETGLRNGWSIEKIAREMAPRLFETGKYAMIRGRMIAKTEAAHALNGARVASIDRVIEETQQQQFIKKEWLALLRNTRASHANLDGVPADADQRWALGGVRCRWPGDINLPANERINCQCTVVSAIGMTDATALQLIQDSEDRLLELDKL